MKSNLQRCSEVVLENKTKLSVGWFRQHSDLFRSIKEQSAAFMQVYETNSRIASIFSTQHRWLMGHIGLSLYFQGVVDPQKDGLTQSTFLENVLAEKVTSRNTAASFLNEMMKYGVLSQRPHPHDRRKKIFEPSSEALQAFGVWISIHARTLDSLDGGHRLSSYQADPGVTPRLQPIIADGLLSSPLIREPSEAFSHFMWVNNGFLLTERLILGMESFSPSARRVETSFKSIQDLASGIALSRSHVARLIQQAELLDILGWTGAKGRSPIWVSDKFIQSFMDIQCAKLSVIHNAFEVAISRGD